jgi:branched-chain amino acid transport system substrate-binding protein
LCLESAVPALCENGANFRYTTRNSGNLGRRRALFRVHVSRKVFEMKRSSRSIVTPIALSAASALSLALLSGCNSGSAPGGGNGVKGDTIPIGIIASMSGPEKPWGDESKNGAALAVEEFNAAGGLNGMKVELIAQDTAGQPEQGKSATERLISSNKVLAVLGEVASGVTKPSADVCQQKGVPIVSIGSTRIDITNTGDMVFRVCYTDDFQGGMMAKLAYDDLGLRRVAILTDKKLPYSTGLSNNFRDVFTKLGGQIVTEEFYEKGQTDFKAQLTNIKAKNPDGLFCSGYFTEIGPIARQKREVGLEVKMFGGDGWDSNELLQSGGEGLMGTYYSNHYSNLEDRPEVKNFVENFKKKYGREPANAMAALGYDAAAVVLDALKRSKGLTSHDLRDAIAETKDFAGVSGTITIGPDGNAHKPGLVLTAEAGPNGPRWVPFKHIPWFDAGIAKVVERPKSEGAGTALQKS